MNHLRVLLLLVLVISCTIDGVATDTFEHFNVEDGLSQYTVFCIAQDKEGFMWFGTKDGLNRYDGRNFKVYRHRQGDSTSLGSNYILTLCSDGQGHLWVGTDNGLYSYDNRYDCFRKVNHTAEDGAMIEGRVNGMLSDRSGRLWLAAGDHGVFCIDSSNDSFWHYPLRCYVQCIEENVDGSFWAGTSAGIYIIDAPTPGSSETSFSKVKATGISLDGCTIRSLICGEEGLYIATIEKGLLVLRDGCISTLVSHGHSFENRAVNTLMRRNGNELFIGEERLYCYDETTHEAVAYGGDSFDFTVYSVFRDRENGIWMGSYYGGIFHYPYDFTPFHCYYAHSDGNTISGERIRELCPDDNGHLWIGSEDGWLSCLDLKTDRFVKFPVNRKGITPRSSNVHGLAFDGRYLWIGYYNGGFDQYDTSTGEIRYRTISQLIGRNVNEDVFALHVSNDKKTLWIGTVSGVYSYDIKTGYISHHEKIGYSFIYDIQEDSDGCLWIATFNAGVIFYDPVSGRISQFRADERNRGAIPSDKVISIFISDSDDVWLTTEGGGICRYLPKNRAFECYDTRKGLPNDVAYKIVEDHEGVLWFGTNNGLVRLNPTNGAVRIYTHRDGLASNLFNYKSGYISEDGRLYFGTVKGLVSFNPAEFEENTFQPTVAFTQFSLLGREMGTGNDSPLNESVNTVTSLTLEPDETTLTFEFALLSYTPSTQAHFQYILEGAGNEWIDIKDNNKVTFTNLRHGDYVFRLRNINGDGLVNSNEKSIQITVKPPFYLTRWAFLIYLSVFLAVLTLLYKTAKRRYIVRHREQMASIEKSKEKEIIEAKVAFFTSVVHEIRTPLTLISAPLEFILKDGHIDEKLRNDLSSIKRNTDRLIQLSNQLLDFRSIDCKERKLSFAETDINQLLREGVERIRPVAEQRNLKITVETVQVTALVDSEAFIKIISNLLGNAVKFAATYIKVQLRMIDDSGRFDLSIENDGKIIPSEVRDRLFEPFFKAGCSQDGFARGTGLGLSLADKLARMHDGELVYSITPHDANLFTLSLPCHNVTQESPQDTLAKSVESHVQPQENVTFAADGTVSDTRPVVMLVEDNNELLDFMRRWLASYYDIVCCSNGAEALRRLDENAADLIVSDIMMPEMDGMTMLKHIKENVRFSHIPIILLSARNTLSTKIESLNYGADAYVEKPFSCSYLQAQIDNLLQKHQYIKHLLSLYPMEAINSPELNETDQKFWSRINGILDRHLDNEHLDMDFLSSEMGMSRSTLKRKFDAISQFTPSEYIRLYRLKKAASYLKSNQYRINEIIDMTGFGSSSYFAKCFKKQFGVLPKEYASQTEDI